MKELLENITRTFDSFRKDAESQLDKGNKSAGLRARRASLDLEPLLKQFRKLSLESANAK
ncbi:histone H1 [Muribaculaceae bacterium Isolate-105 (HZI)]|nr:histone H1 [Muribaculaceae bacterium Isolate-105 (HZI)]